MPDDIEQQFETDLVRWAAVEAIMKYGAEDDEKLNEKVFAAIKAATPEMLMMLLGIMHLDTAQRLAKGLERLLHKRETK